MKTTLAKKNPLLIPKKRWGGVRPLNWPAPIHDAIGKPLKSLKPLGPQILFYNPSTGAWEKNQLAFPLAHSFDRSLILPYSSPQTGTATFTKEDIQILNELMEYKEVQQALHKLLKAKL